jgi:hypothetical protein
MGQIKTAYGYIWSFISNPIEKAQSSDLPQPRAVFHSTKQKEVL